MLTRQTLTRQAFDALVTKIVDDGLQAGDSLPSTAELIDLFGISRPVVREALSALQACGFVELRNGRSPVVAELDGQLIRMFVSHASRLHDSPMSRLMEVRTPLEVQAARMAAERADDAALGRLLRLDEQMRLALSDSDAYPRLDAAFHAEIAAATDNDVLEWMIRSLRAELMTVMLAVRRYRDDHGLVGGEQAQHEEILEAIRAHDVDAAGLAMAEHLTASAALVTEVEHAVGAPRPESMERS